MHPVAEFSRQPSDVLSVAPFHRQREARPGEVMEVIGRKRWGEISHVPGAGCDCRALSILVLVLRDPVSFQKASASRFRSVEIRRWPHCAVLSIHRQEDGSQVGAGVARRIFFQSCGHHGREQR